MNEELLEHVGPGWRQLASDFCERLSAAGFVADEVVSLNGALRVHWHDPLLVGVADARPELAALLLSEAENLARDSRSICEGCGNPGARVTRDDEFYGSQVRTLCHVCGFRWVQGGFSQWSEVTGVLDPLDQLIADSNDGIDPDDDENEGRREPNRITPRPTAGGAAVDDPSRTLT